ncbi:hypothetical protein BC941DRAFT_407455 [Chlamydoabsidia padenii]|nr:hypothetical protein BC941DRAFT_407455 [Chlamydoabsidia padenii]
MVAIPITFLLLFFSLLVEGSVRIMSTNETLRSQPAIFGPKVGDYGLLAHVYEPLDDKYGCQPISGPLTQWIALVKRGRCSFYHKVQAMQRSGALAVIVGDENSAHWIAMYSEENTSDIRIPSLFLTRDEYHHLAQQPSRLVLLEHEDKVFWSVMDWFYLLITVGPLLLFILGWTVIRLKDKATLTHPSQTDLERYLPRQHYTKDDECSICLDLFDHHYGDYRVLPCQHTFHTSCIDPWLTHYRSSCPVCCKESFNHPLK